MGNYDTRRGDHSIKERGAMTYCELAIIETHGKEPHSVYGDGSGDLDKKPKPSCITPYSCMP